MKTVLIIFGIVIALFLFGLLFPLVIAVLFAWLLFFSDGNTFAGVVTVLIGILAEFGYIMGLIGGDDGISFDSSSKKSGLSWPLVFTGLYLYDKSKKKDG